MVMQNLIDTLKTICGDVYQQGALPGTYPQRFFTFWNRSSDDHKHYDGQAYGFAWVVDVNFYSCDISDVYASLDAAREALLAAGWVVSGKGHTVASDTNTHMGRGLEVTFLEI